MNWHPTEDDLVLHYYGEAAEYAESQIENHLRTCATCEAAWRALTEAMTLVDAAGVPEPPADFEQALWTRLARELPRRAAPISPRRTVVFAALAAGLIAVVAAGLLWTHARPPIADVPAAIAREDGTSHTRERVLLTALNDHFSQTEMLLVELKNAPDSGADLDFERTTADDLVKSGRLYRETARQDGDGQLADMLDDLEGVLVEIARSPVTMDRTALNSLRTRIDDNGLLFKVRAVTADIRDRQRALTTEQ